MKKVDVTGKNKETLGKEALELKEKLQSIAFKASGSGSANLKEKRMLKKNIARLLTAFNSIKLDNK